MIHSNLIEKTCLYCEENFLANRIDRQFCSKSCKQMNYKKQLMSKIKLQDGKETEIDTLLINPLEGMNTDFPLSNKLASELKDANWINTNTSLTESKELSTQKEVIVQPENVTYYQPIPYVFSSEWIENLKSLYSNRKRYLDLKITKSIKGTELGSNVWMAEHYFCIVETLLILSEQKQVELDDMIMVYNAINKLIEIEQCNKEHSAFIYLAEMKYWHQKLKSFCIIHQGQKMVQFRLFAETKHELLLQRKELAITNDNIGFAMLLRNLKTIKLSHDSVKKVISYAEKIQELKEKMDKRRALRKQKEWRNSSTSG
jgi:predicted nucleic-acid-binding protein